jgi:hypothetical protein
VKIEDFLTNLGNNPPAPAEPVDFKILHEDSQGERYKLTVNAVFVCLTERQRQAALKAALAYCRKEYPDGVPNDRLAEEERYHLLAEALRDADDPRVQFASVTRLRAAIPPSELGELWVKFTGFIDREFPPSVSPEEFAKLVEDAKTFTFAELLTSTGSMKLSRAFPALLFLYGTSQTTK